MRVRKIQGSSTEFHVIEESSHWYICSTAQNPYVSALLKADCEIVPEERWEDVTSECAIGSCYALLHNNKEINSIVASGYRVRKITWSWLKENGSTHQLVPSFIVERKVSSP